MKRVVFVQVMLILIAALVLTACSAASEPAECRTEGQMKISQSIADTFAVDVELVTSWFCAGHEYEDILLALQTSQGTDLDPQELLERKASGSSWEAIWQEIGLAP
ncbi:MAG TPA: hypothetical protein VFF68_06455 [Anaerolineaceae bacterium]|nr:hypothetical protein [Anaerolineaceae bacterium]